MENEVYLSVDTFGIIIFSLIILVLLAYSAIVTFYFIALKICFSSRKYKYYHGMQVWDIDDKGNTGHIWSLYDAFRRERLLSKFEKLKVKPSDDIQFKVLLPKEERGDNPLQKHLS